MSDKAPLPHIEVLVEQTAVEGLIKGYSQEDLTNILIKDFPELTQEQVVTYIREAHKKIRDTTLTDLDKIIPAHIELYEQIYQEFDDLYFVPGKLKALRQKEKIVGLHKESNFVEIHNEVNVEIEREPEYDISKLNETEQQRLAELMKRALNK